MNKKVTKIIFSPSGSTEKIVDLFCQYANWNTVAKIDLLNDIEISDKTFKEDEIVIVAIPVFYGRVPEIVIQKLQEIKGDNTPVITLVVYGNRDYEDALLELSDNMESKGFVVYGAAAFIARHSIFPKVAKKRPDENDEDNISYFVKQCKKNLDQGIPPTLNIKGNRPYREYSDIPFSPKGNHRCTNCGICAKLCPVQAIDINSLKDTNKDICIKCTACIHNCPTHARSFKGLLYKMVNHKFNKQYREYKEPELFV